MLFEFKAPAETQRLHSILLKSFEILCDIFYALIFKKKWFCKNAVLSNQMISKQFICQRKENNSLEEQR